ncbi:YceI family protein [Helicobacter sp. MIT 14-3879]|uniref:YceI family protein n=1 Tax=Helicobacter sp. MIT 14-3879 TaxID=2040649 RepID=UPI000E1EE996|nr:YceI family protein [Helicobacter sp. MIT 14-3879]RDU65097.1 polyisoprenoid-binding protein [Helicobacter sp. MIT 14-3879]
MKIISKLLIVGALFISILVAKDYNVDVAHSQVEFKVKHLSVSNVKGSFGTFSGTISLDNGKLSALNGEVDVNSINTNNESRDSHIKEKDYFNTAEFPKATLKLVKLEGENGIFDLTIKGITKQIQFTVEVFGTSKNKSNKEVVGLNISGKIDRKDFDIAKSTSNIALGDEVNISIDIEGLEK